MQHPLFTDSTAVVAYIESHYMQKDITRWQGDYELSYVELVERLGGLGDEQEYKVRLAPLHLHIGTNMRLVELTSEQCGQMMFLKYEIYESFLAPHRLLYPQPPAHTASKDMVYVEQICQRPDRSVVARVAPATLHFDGDFTYAFIKQHWLIQGLPLQAAPQASHTCHQRQLLGVLQSFNIDCRL
jgi:hypothetical protein